MAEPISQTIDSPSGDAGRESQPATCIVVCASCRFPGQPADTSPRPGSTLVAATRQAARSADIAVRQVGCLGNCDRGLSAAILREGSWSYLFGGLDCGSADDLLAGAILFAGSTDGFMPYSERPDALRRGLIARIPTAANLKDLT